jgi:hypothetical protein
MYLSSLKISHLCIGVTKSDRHCGTIGELYMDRRSTSCLAIEGSEQGIIVSKSANRSFLMFTLMNADNEQFPSSSNTKLGAK